MREAYLRIVLKVEGVEYIAGLQLLPDDGFASLKVTLKTRMIACTTGLPSGRWQPIAESIERMLIKYWPERSYFIEVGHDSHGWVQIYDGKAFIKREAICGGCSPDCLP